MAQWHVALSMNYTEMTIEAETAKEAQEIALRDAVGEGHVMVEYALEAKEEGKDGDA